MRAFKANKNVGVSNVPELNPGETFKKSIVYLPPGVGWVLWTANVDQIGDADQENNGVRKEVTITGPDLVVAFNTLYQSRVTTTARVKGYIKNRGHAKSKPCKIKIYMEKKGSKTIDVPALARGQIYEVSRGEKYWKAGLKKVSMTIDWEGDVKELSEGNNYVEGSILIIGLVNKINHVYQYVSSHWKTPKPTLDSCW